MNCPLNQATICTNWICTHNGCQKLCGVTLQGNPVIDKSKSYRTRDGREVRIYATDGSLCGGTVHGAWKDPDGDWILDSWHEHGFHRQVNDSPLDLIEVRPRIKREVWVNVYPLHVGLRTYETKSAAISNMDHSCIACVKLTIDCEEGEGL